MKLALFSLYEIRLHYSFIIITNKQQSSAIILSFPEREKPQTKTKRQHHRLLNTHTISPKPTIHTHIPLASLKTRLWLSRIEVSFFFFCGPNYGSNGPIFVCDFCEFCVLCSVIFCLLMMSEVDWKQVVQERERELAEERENSQLLEHELDLEISRVGFLWYCNHFLRSFELCVLSVFIFI
jgi:hypothetical protein